MYRKHLTILLPLYLIFDRFTNYQSIKIASSFFYSESLVVNNDDDKVIKFLRNLTLKQLYFKKKSRIIVLHDISNKSIYKYSSKESGREIKNNYVSLDFVSCLSAPKRLSIIESAYSILTSEEYIELMPISIDDLNNDIYSDYLFKSMCNNLNEYHSKSLQEVNTLYSTELSQYDFLIGKNHLKEF